MASVMYTSWGCAALLLTVMELGRGSVLLGATSQRIASSMGWDRSRSSYEDSDCHGHKAISPLQPITKSTALA
eukprot:3569844-Amphidinium_carterae.1